MPPAFPAELIDLNTLALPEMALPPLPHITSARLQTMAKTHPNTFTQTQPGVLTSAEGMEGYSKLAHTGDSLVGAVVTLIASDQYPSLTKGAATKLKSLCVNNDLFAQISNKYGLPSRLIVGTHQQRTIRTNNIVLASMFEARVAATYYDFLESQVPGMYGADDDIGDEEGEVRDPPLPPLSPLAGRTSGAALDYLCAWLVPLFQRIVDHAHDQINLIVAQSTSYSFNPEVVSSEAVSILHLASQKYGLPNPVYVYQREFPNVGMWDAECTFKWHDGVHYTGGGTGPTKAAAKIEASFQVVKDLGLL